MQNDDQESQSSGLQYDELGFIVGMKRMERSVGHIDANIEAILKLLEQSFNDVKAALAGQPPAPPIPASPPAPQLNAYQRALIDAARTIIDLGDDRQRNGANNQSSARNQDPDTTAPSNNSTSPRQAAGSPNRNQRTGRNSNNSRIPPDSEVVNVDSTDSLRRTFNRQRDANGRFTGDADPANPNANGRERDANGRFTGDGKQSFLGKVTKGITNAIKDITTDTKGVDPTVDAINELGTLLSPIRKVASFALRPLTGLFKSRKKNEPIPREQEQHNRRQLRILQRIADRIGGRGGAGGGLGGGLLGGLFGGLGKMFKGGGKGLLKLLKFGKGIPLLGGLAAGASLFDWKDQSTEERGGTVGSLAGGAAGAAVGSLLGPLGTIVGGVVGAWAGEKLGTVVGPYVKNWTDDLTNADIPGRIVAAWDTFTDGLSAYFKEAWNNIVENAKELVSDVKDTGGSIADFGYSVMDKTLAAMGDKAAQERLAQRERGEIGHQAENYQAKTTHDAPTPWQATKDAAGKLLEQPVAKEQAISKDQKKRMEQVYQSAIGAGFSHRQAVALVGEVGRENDFNPNNMFGSHKDPARGNNLGIFSWQGKRREALQKHMADRGFMNKDGTIQRSQAALQAQFEFAKQEMASNKKWKEGFLDKKEITIDQARPQLGGKGSYVGWALGQTTIRKADGSRVPFDYKSQLNKANSYSATVEKISAAEAKAIQPAAKIPNVAVPTTSPAIVKPLASTPARPIIQPTVTPRSPVQAAASRSTTTAGVTPPKLEPIKIESFSERITSPAPQEVVVVNQNNDTIGQNVSDRGLAHAFTGGIGFNQG